MGFVDARWKGEMTVGEYYLHTDNMTVGYDGVPLISDIGIRVRSGEIVTLIGPNGVGKTTILKTFTRQLARLGGYVYVGDREDRELSGKELARRLSMVMTQRIEPELMTCEEVVSTGRYPYTGSLGILSDADWGKVQEALELVHAEELADRPFAAVSDGQRQRIMLARAICQEPELLILDEPTSYLDIKHKLEILSVIKELVLRKNLAVILSLHELDLAQKVSDQVVCVRGDRIDRVGTPEEVFDRNYIEQLYQLTKGSFDAHFGTVELEPVRGEPEVFVIGGGGSGIATYRAMQRKGIPFAAGILQENDLDYPVAAALASEIISVPAFAAMTEADYEKALACARSCKEVICCVEQFDTGNEMNRRLRDCVKRSPFGGHS